MRRVQEAALDAFEARSFDAVSIEEIARAADVGPATVYRNFGSKERIVLWDEYDPALLEAFAESLRERDVVDAALHAVTTSLARIYDEDAARILRRAKLIRATPALQQAATADQRALQGGFAQVLRASRRAKDQLEAQVFAGALAATLVAALDHWLDGDGNDPLDRCMKLAFRRLQRLSGGGGRSD